MIVVTPCSLKSEVSTSARAGDPPVTTKARLPTLATTGPASRSVPDPKMILEAVANSKRIAYPQPSASGKTLEYFTPCRGSAIISATIARHFW